LVTWTLGLVDVQSIKTEGLGQPTAAGPVEVFFSKIKKSPLIMLCGDLIEKQTNSGGDLEL
jgi:hypothetical protein